MSRFHYAAKVAEAVSRWDVWKLDHETWGWIIFMVYFAVWESYTRGGEQLTNHLRPIFHTAPITWWMAFGLWLWFFPHFLAPALETWLHGTVWTK